MKKGNMLAQPFVFIMALILMGLILVFGMRSVFQINQTADIAEINKFRLNLNNQVELMYNYNVGSIKDVSLNVPMNVEKICFSNPGESVTSDIKGELFAAALEHDTINNIYLFPMDKFSKPNFKISDLRVNSIENPLCFVTKGKLNAVLETVYTNNRLFVEIKK